MLISDYIGGYIGDSVAWGDHEDPADPTSARLEIPVGMLDTLRTADERVWKQFEGVAGQLDVHRVLGDANADLEQVAGQLQSKQFVRSADGYWLEAIAASIGLPRGGMTDDALFRLAIVAESLSQICECSAPETIDLLQRLAGDDADIIYSERYPLGFSAAIPGLSAEIFDVIRVVMKDAIANTVGAYLETYDPEPTTPGDHGVAGWDFPGAPQFDGTMPPPQLREYDAANMLSAPDFLTLTDPIGPDVLTADGTTYDSARDMRRFNGTTDRIDQPNVFDLGTVPVAHSGMAWISPDVVGAGLFVIFVATSTGPAQSVIFRRDGTALDFAHAYTVTGLRRTSGAVLAAGQLAMVGWSYDGSGLGAGVRLYVNGYEVPSYAVTTNASGTPRAADGLWSWGGRSEIDGNNFAGLIGRGRIWDGVLSPEAFARAYIMNIAAGRVAPFGSWSYPTGTDDVRALWSHAAEIGS